MVFFLIDPRILCTFLKDKYYRGKYAIHLESYGFPLFCFVVNQPLFPKKNIPPSQIRKGFIASLVKGNQWFIRFKKPQNFPKDFQVVFRFCHQKKADS